MSPTAPNPDHRQIPILIAALFAWAVLWALLPTFLIVVPPVDNIEQRV